MDRSDRRAQGVAEPGPHPRCEVRAVAAPAERLGHPVPLDVLDRVSGPIPEVAGEALDGGVPSLRGRAPGEAPAVGALHEPDQDPRAPAGWRVVEDDLDRPPVRGGLAVEAVGPPERLVVDRMHLDDAAGRQPLGELVPPARQRRRVVEATGQGRRQGDDRPLGVERLAVGAVGRDGAHRHPGGAALDAPHRMPGADPVAERRGQGVADQPRAADDPVLLGAPVDGQQVLQTGAGAGVEQRVQQRQVPGLRREDRFGCHPEVLPPHRCVEVAPDPRLEGLPVELDRPRRRPWLLQVHPAGQSVEAGQALGQVGQRERTQVRRRAALRAESGASTAQVQDQLTVVEGRERLQSQFGDQLVHAVLGRADPLAAQLDRYAIRGVATFGASADAVPGLDDHDVDAGSRQYPRRGQAGQAGADDRDGGVSDGGAGPHVHAPRRSASGDPSGATARMLSSAGR